nr:hypothetical protein [uncultured Bacteroides sp.]
MKKRSLLILLAGMLFFLSISKPKAQEMTGDTMLKSNTTSLNQKKSQDEEREIIKKVSTSFYDWYLKRITSTDDTTAYRYAFVKGENGKCKADFEPYFNQLRQLKTISKKFMDSEVELAKICTTHMENVDWEDYESTTNAFRYIDFCPEFLSYYWIRSQEPYDGFEIIEMIKKENAWFTTLQFYSDYDNKRFRHNYVCPIVKVENEDGKWLMTEITLKINEYP